MDIDFPDPPESPDTFVVQLPPSADLAIALKTIEGLVQSLQVPGNRVLSKGWSLEHVESLARDHHFTVHLRGRVKLPIELPEPIARRQLLSGGLDAGHHGVPTCALWFDHEGGWLAVRGIEPSKNAARLQLLRDAGLSETVLGLLHVRTQALRPEEWERLSRTPELFEGFTRGLLHTHFDSKHAAAVASSFRAVAFEQEHLELDFDGLAPAFLEAVSKTLGGEFEVSWNERAPLGERSPGLTIDQIALTMHWKRPQLEVTVDGLKPNAIKIRFLEERLGCKVAEKARP